MRQVFCCFLWTITATGFANDQVNWVTSDTSLKTLPVIELSVGDIEEALELPDGKLVIWARGELTIWDLVATEKLHSIQVKDIEIEELMLSRDQREIWGVTTTGVIHRWALPVPKRGWGPEQLLGPPDTHRMGDQITAWASSSQDGQEEWLMLEYAQPVQAREILVYETYNPGALTKITAIKNGEEILLWEGKDPVKTVDGVGVAKVAVETDEPIQQIKLYLNSTEVAGWNEIDAVGVVDADGKKHWATRAAASSTYSNRTTYTKRFGFVRPSPIQVMPTPNDSLPENTTTLKHDDGTAEGKQSYGGTGFAVEFQRDAASSNQLTAIEIFASRYGTSTPPQEDFTVSILNGDMEVIAEKSFPYAVIERGSERWYPLTFDAVEVPQRFSIALDFQANQTKGVYMGKDTDVEISRSFVGTVEKGFRKVEALNWMVRAHLVE